MKRHFQQRLFFALATLLVPGTVLWMHVAMAQDNSGAAFGQGHTEQPRVSGFAPGSLAPARPAGISFPGVTTMYSTAGYQKSPADQERDAKARQLLAKYSKTEDEKERARLLEELTTVVAAQFESRQESREKELQALEEQVRKLRELQTRRAKEQDQIVRDRVRQLLREVDGLGWGDTRNPRDGAPGLFEAAR